MLMYSLWLTPPLPQMHSSADEALAAAVTIADELLQLEADAAAELSRAAAEEARNAAEEKQAAAGKDEEAAAEAARGRHVHLHLHADERVMVEVAEPAHAGEKAAKKGVGNGRHASDSEKEE